MKAEESDHLMAKLNRYPYAFAMQEAMAMNNAGLKIAGIGLRRQSCKDYLNTSGELYSGGVTSTANSDKKEVIQRKKSCP
jgi:hypothetical protein